jgi:hypothetical protein
LPRTGIASEHAANTWKKGYRMDSPFLCPALDNLHVMSLTKQHPTSLNVFVYEIEENKCKRWHKKSATPWLIACTFEGKY